MAEGHTVVNGVSTSGSCSRCLISKDLCLNEFRCFFVLVVVHPFLVRRLPQSHW
jgi:hypothetical protein